MKIKKGNLENLIREAIETVLYPKGGNIGGEHKKPIGDKEISGHSEYTGRSNSVSNEKWMDRFNDYFGTNDEREVQDFLRYAKTYVEQYAKEIGGQYEKNAESNLRIWLTYNPKPSYYPIIGNLNLNLKTPDGIKEFALKSFPEMERVHEYFIRKKNVQESKLRKI